MEFLSDLVIALETIGWTETALAALGLVLLGFLASWVFGLLRIRLNRARARKRIARAEQEAQDRADEEHRTRSLLEETRADFEREKEHAENRISSLKDRLESLRSRLDGRIEMVGKIQRNTTTREREIQNLRDQVDRATDQYRERLIERTNIDPDEMVQSLVDDMISNCDLNTKHYVKRIERLTDARQESRARRTLQQAINRTDVVTPVKVPSAALKFPDQDAYERFKEFYQEHEEDLVETIDSGVRFDEENDIAVVETLKPVEKTIAYRTLNNIIQQKKFHYELIESGIQRYTDQVRNEQHQAARRALNSCSIDRLPDVLFENLGVLYFRTSYGQQQLVHSLEVAHLSAMLAAELGADVKVARRAGLLHDVGKAIDRQRDNGHAVVGANLAEEAGEPNIIVNAIGSHHGDMDAEYVESHIVAAADAISGSRPGARRENMSNYSKKIEELLSVAQDRRGIRKVSAMNAGRELRIRVKRDQISDDDMPRLAREIARDIEDEITYSGEIKVNTIRETFISRSTDQSS